MTKLEMKELEEWQHELHDKSMVKAKAFGEGKRNDGTRLAERRAELLAKVIGQLRDLEKLADRGIFKC